MPATVARLEAWVALSERANAVQRVEDAVARAAKSGCGLFLHANNTLLAAALADAGESLRAERILERSWSIVGKTATASANSGRCSSSRGSEGTMAPREPPTKLL
ncbi:MAG: hypothetical protein IPI67_17740 [Myxococcales bacterium]|nr:hypothetical protein [Myxococcales bacterium]